MGPTPNSSRREGDLETEYDFKKMRHIILFLVCLMATISHAQDILLGGDISMLTKYEEKGAKYYDINGNSIQPLSFFKQEGMNAMRVRLFVDPTSSANTDTKGACQDLDYVIKLGKHIQDAGYKLIVDFHYSDTWADPGKQTLPKAWEGLTTAQLATKVYDYTTYCLQKMKAAGVTPDLIQTGNEITYGMLWPTGQVYPAGGNATGTMANFTSYLSNAIKACREQCPQAKIILHTELGNSHNSTVVFFKKMKEQNIDFDVIGLSYYPDYHGKMAAFNSTLTKLEANNPAKPIMIMETGYGYEYALPGANTSYKEFAITQDGQAEFAKTLISTLKQHNNVMGLFWWWPEANEYGINWQNAVTDSWWNASLFNNRNGRATKALYELKNFLIDNPAGIEGIDDDRQIIRREYYNLLGKPCSANSKGVKIEKIIFSDGKTRIRKTI